MPLQVAPAHAANDEAPLPAHLPQRVLRQAGGRPVTFRTLDIGSDKVVPYFRSAEEENPALGWRAVRLSLDRPGLLRTQLRALLKAAAGAELKLMLPMITEVNELRLARELLNKSDNERSGVLSTAMSFLGLYRDPVIACAA